MEPIFSTQFKRWVGIFQLVETELTRAEKSCSLRDDHGKDELMKYSDKILSSTCVTSVLNSLPFSPHRRSFIQDVQASGIVNSVLP